METLSTTSSLTTTFHVPKTTNHHHHNHLKPTTHHHPHHHQHHPTTLHQNYPFTPLKTNIKTKTTSSLPTIVLPPRKISTHTSAASGYAAALLDISQRDDTVLKVVRDARRLLRVLGSAHVVEFMMDNEVVHDYDKGKIVNDVLDQGKFEVNFVVLVKLVVDKGKKVEFVKEVLVEFLRIFSQLITSSSSSSSSLKSSYVSQSTRLSMGNI
ncbi:hypothetical protein vseg_004536 [Gypsophila vaccaria]